MKNFRKILKVIAYVLFAIGCIWFLLPILRGGFKLGAIFGFVVCAVGILLVRFYKKAVEHGGWQKIAARVITVCYILGMAWAIFLTFQMFSVQYTTPPENTNIIVLGAQVYSAERMGRSLEARVERAYEYLSENPEAQCVTTGGQGSNEPCPEALTEKNVLVQKGIEADRIYMEDKSHNTRENMNFAMEIAEAEGLGSEFVITTQSFHMFRALKLAENTGIDAYPLKADTDPLLFPEYYGRELLSLTKWTVERLILE